MLGLQVGIIINVTTLRQKGILAVESQGISQSHPGSPDTKALSGGKNPGGWLPLLGQEAAENQARGQGLYMISWGQGRAEQGETRKSFGKHDVLLSEAVPSLLWSRTEFTKNRHTFLTVLEAGKSKVKDPLMLC